MKDGDNMKKQKMLKVRWENGDIFEFREEKARGLAAAGKCTLLGENEDTGNPDTIPVWKEVEDQVEMVRSLYGTDSDEPEKPKKKKKGTFASLLGGE